jgi:hypothetical protein
MIKLMHRDFVRYYTDKSSPKTYHDEVESALAAGYSKKKIQVRSRKLLERPEIKALIDGKVGLDIKDASLITIDDKKRIAWTNYMEAKNAGDHAAAKTWFQEHSDLCGHYKKGKDDKDDSRRIAESEAQAILDEIRKHTRNRMIEVN